MHKQAVLRTLHIFLNLVQLVECPVDSHIRSGNDHITILDIAIRHFP